MRSKGAWLAGGRNDLATCGYSGAAAPSFIGAAMRSTARNGSFGHALSVLEGCVVGGFCVAATLAKRSSNAVNPVAGKAMALFRRLFIEAVTISACLSSRKSRAGPFNPPSGKIPPAAKSAPLTLRPRRPTAAYSYE